MWDIGGDEWDIFDVVNIFEVVSLFLDKPELQPVLFNDIVQILTFFKQIIL